MCVLTESWFSSIRALTLDTAAGVCNDQHTSSKGLSLRAGARATRAGWGLWLGLDLGLGLLGLGAMATHE